MASSKPKTRSRSVTPKVTIQRIALGDKDPDLFIKQIEDLAFDEEIKYLKEKNELDLIGAYVAGIGLGLGLIWLMLVMLWVFTHVV